MAWEACKIIWDGVYFVTYQYEILDSSYPAFAGG